MPKLAIKYLSALWFPGLSAAGIALFSCIEQFSLDIDRLPNNYVVEAILLDDSSFQKVVVSKINAEGQKEIFFGGEVVLERGDQSSILFSQTETGEFVARQFIELATGDQYRLLIRAKDSETITSSWEKVPEKIRIKSGKWKSAEFSFINDNGVKITRNVVEFSVDTEILPEEKAFVRYTYETTHINEAPFAGPCFFIECKHCYIQTIPANYLTISGTKNAKGNTFKDQLIDLVPIDKKFSFRLTMLVRQITVTENAYNFYQSVSDQQKLEGSIFDPPPSVIKGNLKIEGSSDANVYGLFELGRLDEVAIDVYRSDIEGVFLRYSDFCSQVAMSGGIVPEECFACFAETGAGPQPYYFE